jgi:hypothetical protein
MVHAVFRRKFLLSIREDLHTIRPVQWAVEIIQVPLQGVAQNACGIGVEGLYGLIHEVDVEQAEMVEIRRCRVKDVVPNSLILSRRNWVGTSDGANPITNYVEADRLIGPEKVCGHLAILEEPTRVR